MKLPRSFPASPVLRGGLPVLLGALGLALLFALGASVGDACFRRDDSPARSALGRFATRSPETTVPAGREALRSLRPIEASGAAEAGSAGSEAVLEDIEKAALSPREPADATPDVEEDAGVDYLDSLFPDVTPGSRQGFNLQGRPSVDTDSASAVYSGTAGSLDLLRLQVVRLKDESAAEQWVDGRAEEFSAWPIEYDWGGRRVFQSMTPEDRPSEYPPAVSLAWSRGRYAIQVTVIPTEPGAVVKARETALEFAAALRY